MFVRLLVATVGGGILLCWMLVVLADPVVVMQRWISISSACWSSRAEDEDFPSAMMSPESPRFPLAPGGSSDGGGGGAPSSRAEDCGVLAPQGPFCILLSLWGVLHHWIFAI